MTTTTESTEFRPAEAIGRIGKHWGWMLAFGILTIAAGICALVWPGITLLAAAIVFGVQLVVAGIYRLVAAFAAPEESTGTRVMLGVLGVLGVLSLIIGLDAVRHVLLTIVALALLLGIFWVANGVIELFTAFSNRESSGRGWLVAMGIVSIVAGVLLLAIPSLSLVVMVFLIGAWLIFFGMLQTALALRLRSTTHSARSGVATPHGAMRPRPGGPGGVT
jgi:uncharacterized membrane protein HdeD (DUF308 family)